MSKMFHKRMSKMLHKKMSKINLALWKHQANLLLQSSLSVLLALMKIRAYGSKLCNNKFTCCLAFPQS